MSAPARASLVASPLVPAGLDRLRRGVGRELLVFATIGVASTAAYAVIFLLLRAAVDAVAANALALVVTAIGNTAANRRLTFGVRGSGSMVRDQVGGFIALVVALVITTASVHVLAALAPQAHRLVELAVLVVANALATVARFVLLRTWIGADRRRAAQPAAETASQAAVQPATQTTARSRS